MRVAAEHGEGLEPPHGFPGEDDFPCASGKVGGQVVAGRSFPGCPGAYQPHVGVVGHIVGIGRELDDLDRVEGAECRGDDVGEARAVGVDRQVFESAVVLLTCWCAGGDRGLGDVVEQGGLADAVAADEDVDVGGGVESGRTLKSRGPFESAGVYWNQ